jgi:lipopolysaccharide transport system ATP-binding protein
MAAVKSLCKSGILLSNGKLSYSGDTANTVSKYMRGGAEYANIRIFGDEYNKANFAIKEIRLHAIDNSIEEPLTEHDEIHIETDLFIHHDESRLNYTYVFKDETGEPIFTITHKQSGIPLKKGLNKLVCKLPKGYLNIGSYHLDAYLIKDSRETIFVEKDILSFNIQEGERGMGAWMGKEPGVIKPIFEWTNNQL